jgi:Fe-S-cluster containining protein
MGSKTRYNRGMLDIVKALLKPGTSRQSGVVRGQYYERAGECHQCGKCCTNIYLVHGDKTIDSLALFEDLKGQNPEYAYFKPVVKAEDGELAFQCQHLQADNTCGIYDKRPDFCRRYPSEHTLLMGGKLAEGCGYQFRLLRNFQDVLKQVSALEADTPKASA